MWHNVAAVETRSPESAIKLTLETRDIGRVTVIQCHGRIIAGGESEGLRSHVAWVLRDRRSIVLHLGGVDFIDSSGLGTLVRTLTSIRQMRGELKLCHVPAHLQKVLELSQLAKLFETHESEEKAVTAFYQARCEGDAPGPGGRNVLCVDSNTDVLAYLRELLRRHGCQVHTSSHLRDAMILMRITKFDGPDVQASPTARQAFQTACAGLPVIELGSEFSTQDAAQASTELLARIDSIFKCASE